LPFVFLLSLMPPPQPSPSILPTLMLLALWIAASWAWGRAFLPFSRRMFPNLLDGGLAAGRLLALVFVGLIAFLGASLHVVSLQLAPLLVVAFPLLSQWWARRNPQAHREFQLWAREKRRDLWVSDAIFVLAWLAFAWVRSQNPALNDLEKPMDSGLLASAARASWLPFDTFWFAGAPFTNYYYFGPLLAALPTRTLATPPHIAYNLAQPLFCALFVSILAALCASLCRQRGDDERTFSSSPWWRGAWAMAIVALLGHWEPLRQMHKAGRFLGPSEVNWWETSRVIEHTINEYPAFTLSIGDAHAHFFALALAALLFSLAWSLFAAPQVLASGTAQVLEAEVLAAAPTKPKNRKKGRGSTSSTSASAVEEPPEDGARGEQVLTSPVAGDRDESRLRWARVGSLGALLGAFVLGNTWDAPLYALLGIAAIVLSQRSSNGAESAAAKTDLAQAAREIGTFLALAVVLALPYLARFQSPAKGVGVALWRPALIEWALLWSGIVVLSVLAYFGSRRVGGARRTLWQVLACCGAAALVAPHAFYIVGFFGGEMQHQDTVFKFGLQAWLLLGTSGAIGTWWLLDSLPRIQRRLGFGAWATLWSVPLLCTLGVLFFRTQIQKSPYAPTLNGASFLPPADAAVVAWLASNARSGSSVLEAVSPEAARDPSKRFFSYNEFGRVASLSGVSTPIGWTQHAFYWGHDLGRESTPRLLQADAVWNAPDAGTARALLGDLGVSHVFIGDLERRLYPPRSIEAIKQAGKVVFEEGAACVVEMPPQS
jgi:uncharacterized membrane protein